MIRKTSLLTVKKINRTFFLILGVCLCGTFDLRSVNLKHSPTELEKNSDSDEIDSDEEKESIWESKPVEIDCARVQILDKISGKVYRENLRTHVPKTFGSLRISLKKCFKNGPESDGEIFALVEIFENEKIIFNDWLFASSPSVNLFSHPIYDVRIEFPNES